MRKKIMALILCCLNLYVLIGCGKKELPKEVPDILKTVYESMKEVQEYSFMSTIDLNMEVSGKESDMKVETQQMVFSHPFQMKICSKISATNQEDKSTELYCIKKDGKYLLYANSMDGWKKEEVGEEEIQKISNQYKSPIPLELYFADVDTYQIMERTKEYTKLEGKVCNDNITKLLGDTYGLSELDLTSIPSDSMSKLSDIQVKMTVDNKSRCILELEVDMTQVYNDLLGELYGTESLTNPKVSNYVMEIKDFKVNIQGELVAPEE